MKPFLAEIKISKLPKSEQKLNGITNKFIVTSEKVVILEMNEKNIIYKQNDNEIKIIETNDIEKMEFIKYEE